LASLFNETVTPVDESPFAGKPFLEEREGDALAEQTDLNDLLQAGPMPLPFGRHGVDSREWARRRMKNGSRKKCENPGQATEPPLSALYAKAVERHRPH
jgi:hypothetical protein